MTSISTARTFLKALSLIAAYAVLANAGVVRKEDLSKADSGQIPTLFELTETNFAEAAGNDFGSGAGSLGKTLQDVQESGAARSAVSSAIESSASGKIPDLINNSGTVGSSGEGSSKSIAEIVGEVTFAAAIQNGASEKEARAAGQAARNSFGPTSGGTDGEKSNGASASESIPSSLQNEPQLENGEADSSLQSETQLENEEADGSLQSEPQLENTETGGSLQSESQSENGEEDGKGITKSAALEEGAAANDIDQSSAGGVINTDAEFEDSPVALVDEAELLDAEESPVTPITPVIGLPITVVSEVSPEDIANDTPESSNQDDGDSACFPAHATVELMNGSFVAMVDLELGKEVRVGANEFSRIFMFTHKLSDGENRFVTLITTSGASITATAGHYIYVNGELSATGSVRVGDFLTLANGQLDSVESVELESARGLFNPQTVQGSIVVNGVLFSTYTTAFEPSFAHAILSPLRALNWFGLSFTALDSGSDAMANVMPRGELIM